MKKLMFGAAGFALLAACNGGGDATPEVTIAEPVLKELSIRAGDPTQAADALAAMSLSDSGSGVLSFAGSTTDGATATFTDLTVTGEDALKAGSLVFEGLDMEGGQAKTLAEALERNVESGDSKIEYLKLSEYMIAQHDYLSGLEDDDFLRGKLSFVEAGEAAK